MNVCMYPYINNIYIYIYTHVHIEDFNVSLPELIMVWLAQAN